MTQEEQKKLLIEASRRYPRGTRFIDSWDDEGISTGEFTEKNDSVWCPGQNVIVWNKIGGWSKILPPKKPFNWKKALAWVILIAIGMPVIYLIVRSGLALASGKGFTGWFLYLGVVAALSGWPLVIWWAIENITSNSKNEKKGD